MSVTVPSRRVAALAVAASGLAAVLSGVFAPAATAAPSPAAAAPATSLATAAAADSWFVDPRTPAQRRAAVAVPRKPERYRGKVRETRAVYRTHDGALAVPMRYAFGHRVARGQALTLDGGGLFKSGSSALTDSAKAQLRKLAASLSDASSVRCEGYADYSGRPGEARSLSRTRAAKVCRQLATLNPGLRQSSVSYGSARPAIVGGTPQQRELNRRVVVEMTGTRPAEPAPTAPQAKVPGPPVLVALRGGVESVRYYFDAPASDGGAAITRYEVSVGGAWTPYQPLLGRRVSHARCRDCRPEADFEGTLAGLPAATLANLRVRAVNKVGAGAPSNTLSAPVYGAPSAPTGLTVTGGDRSLSLTFGAPERDGGEQIYSYDYSTDGGTTWTNLWVPNSPAPWTVDVTGLTNGTTYDVRVRADNGWARGAQATQSVLVATVPSAPDLEEDVQLEGTTATLFFTAPESDGGSAVTGYELTTDGGLTWTAFTATPAPGGFTFVRADLDYGALTKVAVRARNVKGPSEPSKTRSFTATTTPGAPTNVVATVDGRTVTVDFEAPAFDGGTEITGYEVRIDDGGAWVPVVLGSSGLRFTLADQAPGTHVYAVRAVNAAGRSAEAASDAVEVVVLAPGAPTIDAWGYGPADIHFFFTPGENSDAVTGWEVSLDDGPWQTLQHWYDEGQHTAMLMTGCGWGDCDYHHARMRAVHGQGEHSEPSATVYLLPPR